MLIKVLGSAAGGGLPQWNCNGRNSADARSGVAGLAPRTQASVAVSADGAEWVLLNAAPDLRQQINDTPRASSGARRPSAQQPDQGGGADQWRCRCGGRAPDAARRPALHRLRHRARARRAGRQQHFRRARCRSRQARRDGIRAALRRGRSFGSGRHHHRGVSGAGQSAALSRGRDRQGPISARRKATRRASRSPTPPQGVTSSISRAAPGSTMRFARGSRARRSSSSTARSMPMTR